MCLLIQMWGKRKTRSNSFISLELLIRPVTKVFPKILHESKNLREDEHFVYLYIRDHARNCRVSRRERDARQKLFHMAIQL